MKTILVVSDSHGNDEALKELINNTQFDYMFFLGDKLADLENIDAKNIYKVKGNWDFGKNEPLSQIVEVEGVKFFVMHGHTFGVRFGMGYLIKEAEKEGVDVVCYGHTHNADNSNINGIMYLNPGAFSTLKGGKKTYAIIKVDNKKASAQILSYN